MADIELTSRDDALASMLVDDGFANDVRYDHLRSRWLIWEQPRWRVDATRKVYDLIRKKAIVMLDELPKGEEAKSKLISNLFDNAKKEGVLKSLSSWDGIALKGDDWDKEGHLLGFNNGIMDLRTGKFDYNPSRDTKVSKTVGYDWVQPTKGKRVNAEEFLAFLMSVFEDDVTLVAYMTRMLGYSLWGVQTEQKFWMWVGEGSNGKGVLARTMALVMGQYAETPSETLYMRTRFGSAASNVPRPELVRLQGVRFAYMSEPPGKQFNEELLKAHTGEDAILARDLQSKAGEYVEFTPTHKIVFATNKAPETDDVGVSMRRRVRVINFNKVFEGRDADMTIEARVKAEKASIIADLVEQAKRWWNDGVPNLPEPQKVIDWSAEYIAQNDPLTEFIRDDCERDHTAQSSGSNMFRAYQDWLARNNRDGLGQTAFGTAMTKSAGIAKKHGMGGTVYIGIRVKSEAAKVDDGRD